ncbi:MAG: DNA recombination protein RmuC [Candidatus Acidiferrales bacterium]
MEITIVIIIGVLATALGIALGRYVWPAGRASDRDALATALAEAARLNQEGIALQSRTDQLDADHKTVSDKARTAGEEVARLTERVAGLTKQADEQTKQTATLEVQRQTSANEAKAAGAEVARLSERVASLTKKVEEQTNQTTALSVQREAAAKEAKAAVAEVARLTEREIALTDKVATLAAQLADQQKQLTAEFENIANRILKTNATELSANSQKELSAILEPLRQRIQDFQTKVETTYTAENREVLSLKEQIKLILETSHTIGNQADGLAKALRGEPQALGRWGELALERILEAAGLTEGREYVSQGRGLGLKSESGGVQRPDIIVNLPEKRTMIIDSKVPLASYERLIAATDETERGISADQFVKEMKGHIDDLANKRYQENQKLQAHDCVLMFIPIEGAMAAALTREPELFVYAWDRHVVIVGPPTLLMTMRTVASIWRYELQGQNAQDIARLAGDLCDKVSASLDDLNGVAERITEALTAHNEAIKRLSTGKGNALSIGQRIRDLGVKTKKPMPAMLVDGVPLAAPSEDSEESVPSGSDQDA